MFGLATLLQGGTVPRGTESLRGGKKSQQCHTHIFQNSTLASERPQVRTWGRQACFLPQAPSNLVTPLHITIVYQNGEICLQKYLPISDKLSITNFLRQIVVDYYRSYLTIENNLQVEKRYTISKTSTTFPLPQKRLGYAWRQTFQKARKQ